MLGLGPRLAYCCHCIKKGCARSFSPRGRDRSLPEGAMFSGSRRCVAVAVRLLTNNNRYYLALAQLISERLARRPKHFTGLLAYSVLSTVKIDRAKKIIKLESQFSRNVRKDNFSPIRLFLRGPYFLVQRARSRYCCRMPGASPARPRPFRATKTIEANLTLTKKSVKKA